MQRFMNNYTPGIILTLLCLTAGVFAYAANTPAYPPSPNQIANAQNCVLMEGVVSAQGMDSSQSFGITQDNTKPTRPLVDVIIKLTDANTSITRLDTTCTVSHDNNTTDITPQSVSVSGGVATQSDSLKFQRASPGTKNILASFDLVTMPDFECTLSVGGGSGASVDLVTVDVRLCSR